MHIDPSLVGTALPAIEREITGRDTMNYAAAVGDVNPAYLDDASSAGIVAPPLFAVAVTWPLIEGVQQSLGHLIPPEVLSTMVHATEHLIFSRPIRPGDRLHVSGAVEAVTPVKKGTLMVLRMDASDEQGETVFTEYTGAVFRGVACAGTGRGLETLPAITETDSEGSPDWQAEIPTRPESAHIYDGCTNIVFPIHTSRSFARAVGLPDTILQGTATLALAARELVNREAGGHPARLAEIACRFTGIVLPGTSLCMQAWKDCGNGNSTTMGFRVLNEEGRPALNRGMARFKMPL